MTLNQISTNTLSFKNKNPEADLLRKIGRLLRATRKQFGLVQSDVSSRLGLTQSALSRIESGLQVLTAPQWAEFCTMTSISPESILTGRIEFNQEATLLNEKDKPAFKLPKKYLYDRGSKVRAVLPFLEYFESIYGAKSLDEFLESNGIDPDFFVNLDNQISILFIKDLVELLKDKGHIKSSDIPKIAKPVSQPLSHGSLHYAYDSARSDISLSFPLLISNAKLYECNFKYDILEKTKKYIDIGVKPEAHTKFILKQLPNSSFGEFLGKYKKAYFEQFARYGNNPAAAVDHRQSCYEGFDRCIYRLHLAA